MAYERERSAIDEQITEPSPMNMNEGQQGANRERVKRAWRDGSPDEVRDEMKRLVEKSVAAVTGAIRGFTDRARDDDLPRKVGEAVERAGETAQSVVSKTGDQARNMRGSLKRTTHELGETTRDVGSTAADETRSTTETLGEKSRETAESAREQYEGIKDSTKRPGSGPGNY